MRKKTCKRCGEEKLLTMFDRREDGKYGRRAVCKACRSMNGRRTPKVYANEEYVDRAVALVGGDSEILELVAELLATSELSSRRYQRRSAEYALKYVGSDHDALTSEVLFDAWDKSVRQDADLAADLNERLPIITERSEREWVTHKGVSYEDYYEEEYAFDWENDS